GHFQWPSWRGHQGIGGPCDEQASLRVARRRPAKLSLELVESFLEAPHARFRNGSLTWTPLSDRERESERCAVVFVAFRPDAAIVALDDGSTDGEANPEPTTFGRVKRLEQLWRALPVDADARVAHRKANAIALAARRNEQLARATLDAFHRIRSVDDEI